MSITSLDGKRFASMVAMGAAHLSAHADMVDALNVFPVPDGDTGTNMNLSMTSGAKEVQQNTSSHFGKTAASLSKGLLMGARGNSGVILSQLFRGFSKAVENKMEVTSVELAQAFEAGVETAYKAVMKPVEGTILTVAKEAAKKAVHFSESQTDVIAVMEALVEEARASLARTPDHLPVLKEVGVVDSGGQGLLLVYEGFLAELKGEGLPENAGIMISMDELVSAEHHKSVQSFMDTADIEFGYCTEFMVRFEEDKVKNNPFSEEKFRADLSKYGDSLLVIADDEIAKVHIHSEQPGEVLTYGQQYGSLINMKIENMRQQHSNIIDRPNKVPAAAAVQTEKQEIGIVAVCMGEGVAKLFESIGASVVIEGGQTMNPSTEDIVKAIEEVNANKVIILPNNKNIIMAAEQAAQVGKTEAVVIPSKTVPQGMTSLLAYNPEADLEENKSAMTAALAHVKTGQITFAVRDTNIDGIEIAKGDFMGIADGKILLTDKNKINAAKQLLQAMLDEESEIITIIYGEDASQEEADEIAHFIEEHFEEAEVEIHSGGQPLYSFILAVE
ncbi:DAK2 domain-containing protein [Bacillus sp. B190/17]|uniref:DAK2 domain-containing protein n=1 Tax=Bacillus lumedeiriae TaxID=3058829 RepID=A0ABW8I643_9BACI